MGIQNGYRQLPAWLAPLWIEQVNLTGVVVKSTFEPFGQNMVVNDYNAGQNDHWTAVLQTIKLEWYDADRFTAFCREVGKMGQIAIQDPMFRAPGADGFRDAMSNGLVNGATFNGYFVDADGYPGGKLILRHGQYFNLGQYLFQATRDVVSTNGETNLLLRSEQFENASWSKPGGATVSNNTTETVDPFRGTNADKITAANAASGGIIRQAYAAHAHNTAHALSIYVKKGNWPYIGFRLMDEVATDGVPTLYTFFDLDKRTWTKQQAVSSIAVSAVELNDDWWRLTIVGTTPGVHVDDNVDISLVDASGDATWTPAGTEYVYLYGAQLQTGSASTPYIATTTTSSSESGTARIPFWPRLKETIADNTEIDTNNPYLHGHLVNIPHRDVRSGSAARQMSIAIKETI